MQNDPRNILVIHIAGLAQSMLALPALRSLRKHLPRSRITIVSSAAAADLMRVAGCADEVLTFGRFKRFEALRPSAFYRSLRAFGELRRGDFDLAIELSGNTESGITLQLANPRARLNKSSELSRGLSLIVDRISHALKRDKSTIRHDAHEYLKRLESLGVRPIEAEPALTTDREQDRLTEKLLNRYGVGFGELLIGFHPGSVDPGKRWAIDRFASIASRMIHNFNARALIFAGPAEKGMAKKIAAMLPDKKAIPIELPSIGEYLSASARLSLMIANHSGPAHMAAAVGTPVVVASLTSGPSPQDLLGRHIVHVRAPHIDLIAEEEVYEAACRLLKISRAEFLQAR